MTGILSGIHILDLSRVMAGPYATQTLAGMGAEVIKIERPNTGDDTRQWGPPFATREDGEKFSAYFMSINSGKKSVVADFTKAEGQELVKRLAAKSDVIIENFLPGTLAKYGLDYDSIKKIKSDIIYCSITGFGFGNNMSHLPGYDFVVQALGGMMSITGEPEGQPVRTAVAVADAATGLYAAIGIMGALYKRKETGQGERIDVSLISSITSLLSYQSMNYLVSGENPPRMGNGHPNIVPYQAFKAKDGMVVVAVGNDAQFAKFCEAIKMPELLQDERFITNRARVGNREALVSILEKEILKFTAAEMQELLWKNDIPGGKVNNMDEVFRLDPVLKKSKPKKGFAKQILFTELPINFASSPNPDLSPPPAIGEHTEEVEKEIS